MYTKKNIFSLGIWFCFVIIITIIIYWFNVIYLNSILHKDLRNKTIDTSYISTGDKENYAKQLQSLNQDITQGTGMTADQIMMKARLLGYLGKVGESIKLYEENYSHTGNYDLIAYNHNMGRVYESVGKYGLAIQKYQYIIDTYKMDQYYQDIAEAYQKRWKQWKYNEYMAKYIGMKTIIK